MNSHTGPHIVRSPDRETYRNLSLDIAGEGGCREDEIRRVDGAKHRSDHVDLYANLAFSLFRRVEYTFLKQRLQ